MKQDLLIFSLGTPERFAVDVATSREIITLGQLNQLPGASCLVLGVTRVREVIIPVIDTHAILFGHVRPESPKMAIVLDIQPPIALAVAEVSHVHKFDSAHHAHDAGRWPYVEMIIQDEGALIQKLHTESLARSILKAQPDLQGQAA